MGNVEGERMKFDRTLNRDEVQEVVDALKEGKLEENNLSEYQRAYEHWATSTSGGCNCTVHRTEAQKGKG